VVDLLKKYYVTKIKGYDPMKMCVATCLFEGEKEECLSQEKFIYETCKKYNGLPAGEENGMRGYILTYVIAYVRDIG